MHEPRNLYEVCEFILDHSVKNDHPAMWDGKSKFIPGMYAVKCKLEEDENKENLGKLVKVLGNEFEAEYQGQTFTVVEVEFFDPIHIRTVNPDGTVSDEKLESAQEATGACIMVEHLRDVNENDLRENWSKITRKLAEELSNENRFSFEDLAQHRAGLALQYHVLASKLPRG